MRGPIYRLDPQYAVGGGIDSRSQQLQLQESASQLSAAPGRNQQRLALMAKPGPLGGVPTGLAVSGFSAQRELARSIEDMSLKTRRLAQENAALRDAIEELRRRFYTRSGHVDDVLLEAMAFTGVAVKPPPLDFSAVSYFEDIGYGGWARADGAPWAPPEGLQRTPEGAPRLAGASEAEAMAAVRDLIAQFPLHRDEETVVDAAFAAALQAPPVPTPPPQPEFEEAQAWRLADLLADESVDLGGVVAKLLLARAERAAAAQGRPLDSALELEMIKQLASPSHGVGLIKSILREQPLLDAISESVWRALLPLAGEPGTDRAGLTEPDFDRNLWAAFKALAKKDGGDSISRVELGVALDAAGLQPSRYTAEQSQMVSEHADEARLGALEWPEFRRLGHRIRGLERLAKDPKKAMSTAKVEAEALVGGTGGTGSTAGGTAGSAAVGGSGLTVRMRLLVPKAQGLTLVGVTNALRRKLPAGCDVLPQLVPAAEKGGGTWVDATISGPSDGTVRKAHDALKTASPAAVESWLP